MQHKYRNNYAAVINQTPNSLIHGVNTRMIILYYNYFIQGYLKRSKLDSLFYTVEFACNYILYYRYMILYARIFRYKRRWNT